MYEEIFNEETKQEEVYKTVVQPLISDILMGYHCTVFAYGQTGTGKTYTIEGERSNKSIPWKEDHLAGIIPRTLFDLFKELSRSENEFSIHISAVQIYNEEIIDLLNENESTKLKMFEDNIVKGSILIQGLTEISVCTLEESYNVIETAMSKRQTTATLAHDSSSRSHAVFTISVITKTNNKVEIHKMGKLTIVDLAGNENIGRSGAVHRQAREAGCINQSLLTLNRVTMALVRKAFHIPYRGSKLTRILQDSLGGHCKTTLIATISSTMSNIEETISTLEYAFLAKSVTNYPKVNQKINKISSIKEFREKKSQLQRDLFPTLDKCEINLSEESYCMLKSELNAVRKEFNDKTCEIDKLEQKLKQRELLTTNVENELSINKEEVKKPKKNLEKENVKLKKITKEQNLLKKKTPPECEDAKQFALWQKENEDKRLEQTKQRELLTTNVENELSINKEEVKKPKKNLEKENVKLKKITKEQNLLKKKTPPECEDAKQFALWQKENEDKRLEQTKQAERKEDKFLQKLDDLVNKTRYITDCWKRTFGDNPEVKLVGELQIEESLKSESTLFSPLEKKQEVTSINTIDQDQSGKASKSNKFQLRHAAMFRELKELEHTLALKEDLESHMKETDSQIFVRRMLYECFLKQLKEEVSKLQVVKQELSAQLRVLFPTDKESENRRKHLQELAIQICRLKKEMTEKSRWLKIKEVRNRRLKILQKEIESLKQKQIQLVRRMAEEDRKSQHWIFQKDRELSHLKQQDRKRQFELIKMEHKYTKLHQELQKKIQDTAANSSLQDDIQLQWTTSERHEKEKDQHTQNLENFIQSGAIPKRWSDRRQKKKMNTVLDSEIVLVSKTRTSELLSQPTAVFRGGRQGT